MENIEIESELKKIKKNQKRITRSQLIYKGTTQYHDVFAIPADLIQYNIQNGRIAAKAMDYTADGMDLSTLPKDQRQELIGDWIWDEHIKENKDTLENIRQYGQQQPGVVTRNGIIVDGNRRYRLISELNRDNDSRLPFNAIILDEDYLDNSGVDWDLKLLENELQRKVDNPVTYGANNKYIEVNKMYELHLKDPDNYTKKSIIASFPKIKNEEDLDKYLRTYKLMDEYLIYIGAKEKWSRLENAEDNFLAFQQCWKSLNSKGLKNVKVNWSPKKSDFFLFKITGFNLLRWVYNKTAEKDKRNQDKRFNPKYIKDTYFNVNSETSIFHRENVFKEFCEKVSKNSKKVTSELPTIREHIKENNSNDTSRAAKQIDLKYSHLMGGTFKEVLGIADNRIQDKRNEAQPGKFLEQALHKLENLIAESIYNESNQIELNENMLAILEKDKRSKEYANKIRRISEKLKQRL